MVIEPDLIRDTYEKEMKSQERKVRDMFHRAGADFISIQTDKPYSQPIITLFRARALRWK